MICGINNCNDDGFLQIFYVFIDFLPIFIFSLIIFSFFYFFIWLFPEISGGLALPTKRVFRFGKYYRGLKEK